MTLGNQKTKETWNDVNPLKNIFLKIFNDYISFIEVCSPTHLEIYFCRKDDSANAALHILRIFPAVYAAQMDLQLDSIASSAQK